MWVGVSYLLAKDDKAEHLTKNQAKNIILEKVPDGKILEFSYDNENNSPKYESEIVKDTMKYQVDVDAETGKIINFEQEVLKDQNDGKTSDKLISEDKAMDIMMNKVPKSTIQKFNLDKDGKNAEYEGVLTKVDIKYGITVDAKTGDIKEFRHEQVKDTKADKDNQYGDIEIND